MTRNPNLNELEAQAAFIRQTLEEARERLKDQPLVIAYDNGGGQTGIRENPEWIAFEKLQKSYHATLRAIALQQDRKATAKTTGIGSPLTSLRGKYGNFEAVKQDA